MRVRQGLARNGSRPCELIPWIGAHRDGKELIFLSSTLHIGGPISKHKLGKVTILKRIVGVTFECSVILIPKSIITGLTTTRKGIKFILVLMFQQLLEKLW